MLFLLDEHRNRKLKLKAFWEDYYHRNEGRVTGTHSDHYVVELENWFFLKHLNGFRPRFSLDLGCGNGKRTVLFSKHIDGSVLGVDYSEIAIRHAKSLENDRVCFEQWDVEDKPRWRRKFDCVFACRVLINLQSRQAQLAAIRKIAELLNAGGILLLSEGSEQGHEALNELRQRLDLYPTNTIWHNLLLDEPHFFEELRKHFRVLDVTRFGLYFVLTNAIYPASLNGEAMSKEMSRDAIRRIAVDLQQRFYSSVMNFDRYGEHLTLAAIKYSK